MREACLGGRCRHKAYRKTFGTRAEPRIALFDHIAAFYFPKRRHSVLGQAPPDDFERAARLSEEA